MVTFSQSSIYFGYLGTYRFFALRNFVLFDDSILLDGRKEIGVIITLIKKGQKPFAGSPLPGKALSPVAAV